MLIDSFGRRIDYLRLSVTDHCNLRCVYCLPLKGFSFSPMGEFLTDEEIVRIVSIAAGLGISKIRVTGGEPLVRPGIVLLAKELGQIPGIEDISLSTNGVLLSKFAKDLLDAGIKRINVSLDTLRPERFSQITRFGRVENVWDGINEALTVGFDPVKINVVVMKGINHDEIPDFVALTNRLPIHVRFIELMPIGQTGFFSPEHWLALKEIRELCGPLEVLERDEAPRGFGPASYFEAPGAMGSVGFISALSCNFCARCNRLRLTARGRLMPCLASEMGRNLKALVRGSASSSDEEIAQVIREVVEMKPERHQMSDAARASVSEAFMCSLGG